VRGEVVAEGGEFVGAAGKGCFLKCDISPATAPLGRRTIAFDPKTGHVFTMGQERGQAPPPPPGGGRVGLLLISKYVKPGSVNVISDYNHFSLLASIEDLFGLGRLGYAGSVGLPVFDASVYNAGSH